MKLSELIREYVDLKIEGEPSHSDWRSIDADAKMRAAHHQRLAELEDEIDATIAKAQPGATEGGA
jgi:hypothetical protein